MAAVTDLVLTNNDNSKSILLRAVAPMKQTKLQPPIIIPLINATAANAIIFRFFGQQEEVSFTCALFDDGTDVASGTHSSAVTTASEQKIYLMEEIFTEDFDVDWTLSAGGSGYAALSGTNSVTGVIDNISFDHNKGYAGSIIIAAISFKRGNIGNL